MHTRLAWTRRWVAVGFACVAGCLCPQAQAQISPSGPLTPGKHGAGVAGLDDQLVNRLRAITEEQQAFVRYVVRQVDEGRLERGLVLAIERYALRRNRLLPFNYFERAMRFEASRRGVDLPSVQQFVSTKFPRNGRYR